LLLIINLLFVFLSPSARNFSNFYPKFFKLFSSYFFLSLRRITIRLYNLTLLSFNYYLLTNHLSQIPLITADFPSTFVLAKASYPADLYRECLRFFVVRFCGICQTALAGISGHRLA